MHNASARARAMQKSSSGPRPESFVQLLALVAAAACLARRKRRSLNRLLARAMRTRGWTGAKYSPGHA
eukprot:6164701-Lingulodinium_polyedra.AAC.1